jgi:hypothetical protein
MLRRKRRSRSEFQAWKPDVFYYLYSLAAGVVAAGLAGTSMLGLRSIITGGFCFGFLCCGPKLWNRARYWAFIGRPNQLLERRIASLEEQIKQLEGGPTGTEGADADLQSSGNGG